MTKTTSKNKTMKAIAVNNVCNDFKLVEVSLDIPEVNEGYHLVKIECVGLNQIDGKLAQCGIDAWNYPHVLGLDAVGIVVENSLGSAPAIGTRVAWHHNLKEQGVLSEYVCVPSHALIEVPKSVTPEVAATVPCAGMTAYLTLERLNLHEDQTILIKGGASTVGQFAIQLANNIGYRVITTAKSENSAWLRQLGAEHVIDYNETDIKKSILEITCERGVDAIVDTIGGKSTASDLDSLRFAGSIACLAPFDAIDNARMFTKAPTIIAISLNGAWLADDMCGQLKMAFIGQKLFNCVASGKLKTPTVVPVKFDPSEIENGLKQQMAGLIKGKQVVSLK
ncbi:zinc-binding dehydrogenase [Psychrosphaera haliotis]|uniref:zinc-binding dehydrogenase n=1 Tax=Psychrosphaera haliotis TaxID=555083 RepID=UPI002368FBC4|nr:zinc-binding dehydrogenase [Psychrosphaera haliotis]